MRHIKTTETILFSILFLFFLQSLADFIESIYAFALLARAFPPEVAAILLIFTSLLLIFFPKAPSRSLLLAVAWVAILARLLEPMLAPAGRLVACGISVGAFLLFFPALLHNRVHIRGWQIASGLVIALSLSIFFRIANSGSDLSESGMFQVIGWLMGILAVYLLGLVELPPAADFSPDKAASGGRVTGLAIGLASVILLLYFAFASPTVMARWTGLSYPAIVITLAVVLALFSLLLGSEGFSAWLTRDILLIWNVFFSLALVLTILPHQIAFPLDRNAYPMDAPAVPPLAGIFPFVMLILSPVLFLDFMLFARQVSFEKPSLHQIGYGFGAASLFFLVMVFLHVFTTVYDYVPIVGPPLRDRFWFVHLLAGLGIGLPALLLRREIFPLGRPDLASSFTPLTLGTLAVLSAIVLSVTAPRPLPPRGNMQLKVLTYNIQQGFDAQGNRNLEGQLAVIRDFDPDIVGLQESDTARLANGNVDAVRYFADKLDMYSYYGPTTTTGTFGIALLSRYPIQDPTTFFMYSPAEQTATIHAEITAGGKTYKIFVTHLGNGGPIFQLEDILARTRGLENLIVMGDFNFRPPTNQYTLITTTLADSWLLKWPGGKKISGIAREDRIDYIFVSPRTSILEAEYGVSPASDHPYMYAVIGP